MDENGQPLGRPRKEQFGDVVLNKTEVEERIRRAQRAILNPSSPARHFLNGEDKDPEVVELTFSSNYVSLEISGCEVADLSFCDLPGTSVVVTCRNLFQRFIRCLHSGLIASVGTGGNEGDIELVQSLATRYIKKSSCIILLTVACESKS